MVYNNNSVFLKTILAFLDSMSGYTIPRIDQNQNITMIPVPIKYAHPENYIARLVDENQTIRTNFPLPTMVAEMTGFNYDNTRKLTKTTTVTFTNKSNQSLSQTFTPIPYNLDIKLSILCKSYYDLFQLVEQILSRYSPSLNLDVLILGPNYNSDSIPFIINHVTPQFPGELGIKEQRLIELEIDFTARVNIYKPLITPTQIETIFLNTYDLETWQKFMEYTITETNVSGINFEG